MIRNLGNLNSPVEQWRGKKKQKKNGYMLHYSDGVVRVNKELKSLRVFCNDARSLLLSPSVLL